MGQDESARSSEPSDEHEQQVPVLAERQDFLCHPALIRCTRLGEHLELRGVLREVREGQPGGASLKQWRKRASGQRLRAHQEGSINGYSRTLRTTRIGMKQAIGKSGERSQFGPRFGARQGGGREGTDPVR